MLSAWLLVRSVVMLLAMTMPIKEFNEVSTDFRSFLYKIVCWMLAILSANLVAMVTLLISAIMTLSANVTRHDAVETLLVLPRGK